MTKLCLHITTLIALTLNAPLAFSQDAAANGNAAEGAENAEQGIAGEPAKELVVEKWIQLPTGKEKLSIEDYKGKVLIMLFFQYTSEGCQDVAFPLLKELSDHYKGNDKVQFLAVQTAFSNVLDNTADKLEPVAKKFGFTFPIGHYTYTPSYPGMSGLRGTYKNPHVPWFIVVGPDGVVQYNGTQISVEMSIENIDDLIK